MAVAKKKKLLPQHKLFIERQKSSGGRLGGREKGTPNKMTRLLKEAIPEALERLGSDGKGKDGIVGFLMVAARKETAAYLRLLDRLLPYQITGHDGEAMKIKYTNKVEIVARLKERGLPVPESLLANDISEERPMKLVESKKTE